MPTRHVLGFIFLTALLITSTTDAQNGIGPAAGPALDTGRPSILEGDAIPDLILSPESGVQPTRVIDGSSGVELGAGFPFGAAPGGARIAAGDLNADGVADIVAGMGPGGSFVQVFDGRTIGSLGGGFPFGGFGGGVFLALGDVNGDGRNDIGVSQGQGGGGVRVFSGVNYSMLVNLTPFGSYNGGVTLAMGDLNADGRADLIVGQLSGGLVSIIDGATQTTIVSGAPFGGFNGGIYVAAGDINGDGRSDIILAPGTRGGGVVVYDLQSVSQLAAFAPYGGSFASGVRVAAADVNGDGRADIVTGPGPGGGNEVRVFSGANLSQQLLSVTATGYTAGVFVAATQLNQALRFTSATTTTFTYGQAGTFTVQTIPSASLAVSGALPAGVTFTNHGNGTATLAGTATASGSFPLTFTATAGGQPPVTQNFVLTVNQPPAITSANAVTFSVGAASSFSVTTTGFPVPALQSTGTLPSGVTFTNNGNGTATLAGTPAGGTTGTYPLSFSASNGVGAPAVQNFTLTVGGTCTGSITPPSGALPAGIYNQPYSQTFSATGGSGYTFAVSSGALPSGLALSSAGALTGSPTATGVFTFAVTATPASGCVQMGNYTLTVSPSAQNETFSNGVGNTQYSVGAGTPATPAVVVAGSVLANDAGPGALTASPALIASANGGQVAMNANGSFLYTPAAGFAGPSDTFVYTMTDGNGRTATATVTINLSGVVWYVNAAASAGDGRSQAPFNAMPAAAAAALGGQIIYVHTGSPSGATALKPSQTLWGAGATFTLNGLTIPASTAPVLGGTVTLANGDQVVGLSINGGGGAAVVGSGITGTVTLSSVAVVGGSTGVLINGGSGTINVGATITLSGGRLVDIQNRTGGAVTFTGLITDDTGVLPRTTSTGIFMNNNTGSTIAFTGGLNVATVAADAFAATGGGTVTATQNNTTIVNALASESGSALRVVQTEIGAAGLTFQRLDAGAGTSTGVFLDQTGVAAGNGSLTVTGNGTAGSGGRIRQKSGTSSPSQGMGYYFRSTKNPSLNLVHLDDLANAAIHGRDVAGFTLTNSLIEGDNGSTTGSNQGALIFGAPNPSGYNGATGAVTLADNQISGSVEHNGAFYNQSGSLTLLVQSTTQDPSVCQLSDNSATTGAAGLRIQAEGTAVTTVTVDHCRLRNNRLVGLLATADGNAALSVTMTGSEVVHSSIGQQGVVMTHGGNADLTTTISHTAFLGFPDGGLFIGQLGDATAQAMLRASIVSNNFESSTNATAPVILFRLSSTAGQVTQSRVLLQENGWVNTPHINQYGLPPGIRVETPDAGSSPSLNLTMINNHVDMLMSDTNMRGPNGTEVSVTNGTACTNLLGNFSHNYPLGQSFGGGIVLTQAGSAVVDLEIGAAGGGSDAATVLDVNHPEVETPTSVVGTVGVVANGTCLLPSAP